MYPYLTGPNAISNRDVETMRLAYTMPPDLDMSALPKQITSGAPANTLIRWVHRYQADGSYTLEFNPPQ